MRAGELEERLEALKQAVKQSEARKTSEDAALEDVRVCVCVFVFLL